MTDLDDALDEALWEAVVVQVAQSQRTYELIAEAAGKVRWKARRAGLTRKQAGMLVEMMISGEIKS
ncbi:hypothetical protein DR950_36250 [Kitasatospora xanthocidica]|uniref:Uncharacterized protein n=1 Tax=Kitasatospora xanthocidica TaxID=83382 RepID=A0A373A4X9_9ACTN|nr:hypothetical protein [Kitasatospora xanthocidica]RGD62485.1 hypothetical protein DR950_36250 [Kitasatospora xanthocidica]